MPPSSSAAAINDAQVDKASHGHSHDRLGAPGEEGSDCPCDDEEADGYDHRYRASISQARNRMRAPAANRMTGNHQHAHHRTGRIVAHVQIGKCHEQFSNHEGDRDEPDQAQRQPEHNRRNQQADVAGAMAEYHAVPRAPRRAVAAR